MQLCETSHCYYIKFDFCVTCQLYPDLLQVGLSRITQMELLGILEQDFLQARCASRHPTNHVVALKGKTNYAW